MRILLELSAALPPRTGVGVYGRELARALVSLDSPHRFACFFNSLRRPSLDDEWLREPRVETLRRHVPGPLLLRSWQYLNFPSIEGLARSPADLIHAAGSVIPPHRSRAPLVATIQDLAFLHRPQDSHPLGGAYLRDTLPRRLPQCAAIVTPTEAVRRELIAAWPRLVPGASAPADRIQAIHHGVDHQRFRPISDPAILEGVRRRHNLPVEFILGVGAIEPRKNIPGLLAAWRHLASMMPAPPRIVWAGPAGWKMGSLHEVMRRLDIVEGRDIVFCSPSDDDMPALYNVARLFVLPSHDEGFGLPLVEAMACGLPAVTSGAPALLEVGAGAAAHAPPDDPGALAALLRDILTDPYRAAAMREASLLRAAGFSWRRCAEQTLAVYEQAAQGMG